MLPQVSQSTGAACGGSGGLPPGIHSPRPRLKRRSWSGPLVSLLTTFLTLANTLLGRPCLFLLPSNLMGCGLLRLLCLTPAEEDGPHHSPNPWHSLPAAQRQSSHPIQVPQPRGGVALLQPHFKASAQAASPPLADLPASLLQSEMKAASKKTQLPADSAHAADPVASSLMQPQPERFDVLHRPANIPAKLQQLANRDSQRRLKLPTVQGGELVAGLARGIKAEWQLPRSVPEEGISDPDGLHEFGSYQPLPSIAASPRLQQPPSEARKPIDGRFVRRPALQTLEPPDISLVSCVSSHGRRRLSNWQIDAQTATSDTGPKGPLETRGSVGHHDELLSQPVWPATDADGLWGLTQPGRQLLPTAVAIGRHDASSQERKLQPSRTIWPVDERMHGSSAHLACPACHRGPSHCHEERSAVSRPPATCNSGAQYATPPEEGSIQACLQHLHLLRLGCYCHQQPGGAVTICSGCSVHIFAQIRHCFSLS